VLQRCRCQLSVALTGRLSSFCITPSPTCQPLVTTHTKPAESCSLASSHQSSVEREHKEITARGTVQHHHLVNWQFTRSSGFLFPGSGGHLKPRRAGSSRLRAAMARGMTACTCKPWEEALKRSHRRVSPWISCATIIPSARCASRLSY
jgi:hypothetical protein